MKRNQPDIANVNDGAEAAAAAVVSKRVEGIQYKSDEKKALPSNTNRHTESKI